MALRYSYLLAPGGSLSTSPVFSRKPYQKRISEDFNIPEIIERLKKEKLESEDTWHRQGERSGLEWARRAHYLDLKNVLRQQIRTPFQRSLQGAPFSQKLILFMLSRKGIHSLPFVMD